AEGSGPSDKLCLGFAAGRDAFDRGFINAQAGDTATTAIDMRDGRTPVVDTGCLELLASIQVILRADLAGFHEDGFDLSWTTTDGTQRLILYLALGGDGMTQYMSGYFVAKGTTGAQAVTGIEFKPDALLLFTSGVSGTSIA